MLSTVVAIGVASDPWCDGRKKPDHIAVVPHKKQNYVDKFSFVRTPKVCNISNIYV
jgi:hypothetical protein